MSFFGQCTVLLDFVLYNGQESGVDGDEIKGVGVYKGDCKGLKLGVSATSKISDVTLKINLQE